MGDLIDRDALLAECAEAQKSDPNFDGRGWANHFINSAGEPSAEWNAVEAMIEYAPAVDAAPVVHGRLLRTDAYPHRLYCSNCYHTIVPNEEMVPLYNMTINYCLHCGAKFDGGEV